MVIVLLPLKFQRFTIVHLSTVDLPESRQMLPSILRASATPVTSSSCFMCSNASRPRLIAGS